MLQNASELYQVRAGELQSIHDISIPFLIRSDSCKNIGARYLLELYKRPIIFQASLKTARIYEFHPRSGVNLGFNRRSKQEASLREQPDIMIGENLRSSR